MVLLHRESESSEVDIVALDLLAHKASKLKDRVLLIDNRLQLIEDQFTRNKVALDRMINNQSNRFGEMFHMMKDMLKSLNQLKSPTHMECASPSPSCDIHIPVMNAFESKDEARSDIDSFERSYDTVEDSIEVKMKTYTERNFDISIEVLSIPSLLVTKSEYVKLGFRSLLGCGQTVVHLSISNVCQIASKTILSDLFLLWCFTETLSTLNMSGFGKPPPRPPDISNGLITYQEFLNEGRQVALRHHIIFCFPRTFKTTEHKPDRLMSYPRSLPCMLVYVLNLRKSEEQVTKLLEYKLNERVESDSSIYFEPLMYIAEDGRLVNGDMMKVVHSVEGSITDAQGFVYWTLKEHVTDALHKVLIIPVALSEFKVNGELTNISKSEVLSNWMAFNQPFSYDLFWIRVEIDHNCWNLFTIFQICYWTYAIIKCLHLKHFIGFSRGIVSHGGLELCLNSYMLDTMNILVSNDSNWGVKDMTVICKSFTNQLIWLLCIQDILEGLEVAATGCITIWTSFEVFISKKTQHYSQVLTFLYYGRHFGNMSTTSEVDSCANQWYYALIFFIQVWMVFDICSDSLMVKLHAQRVSICFFGRMIHKECDLLFIALSKCRCMLLYLGAGYTTVAQGFTKSPLLPPNLKLSVWFYIWCTLNKISPDRSVSMEFLKEVVEVGNIEVTSIILEFGWIYVPSQVQTRQGSGIQNAKLFLLSQMNDKILQSTAKRDEGLVQLHSPHLLSTKDYHIGRKCQLSSLFSFQRFLLIECQVSISFGYKCMDSIHGNSWMLLSLLEIAFEQFIGGFKGGTSISLYIPRKKWTMPVVPITEEYTLSAALMAGHMDSKVITSSYEDTLWRYKCKAMKTNYTLAAGLRVLWDDNVAEFKELNVIRGDLLNTTNYSLSKTPLFDPIRVGSEALPFLFSASVQLLDMFFSIVCQNGTSAIKEWCCKLRMVLQVDITAMVICTSLFFIFSLPRPPEFFDLEDKVISKGEGMLQSRIRLIF